MVVLSGDHDLLISQCHDGIDPRGAASGDGASGQRHDEQQNSDAQERKPVARSDTVKQAPQEAREREAGGHPNGYASESGADALANDHSHDVATLRAQSQADADFTTALQHHVRDQPV